MFDKPKYREYLKAVKAAGIPWPLPMDGDETRLQEALFGKQRSVERPSQHVLPDFRAIHEELNPAYLLALNSSTPA